LSGSRSGTKFPTLSSLDTYAPCGYTCLANSGIVSSTGTNMIAQGDTLGTKTVIMIFRPERANRAV
jgi:hypothetical protein